jgi:hypothetical protein
MRNKLTNILLKLALGLIIVVTILGQPIFVSAAPVPLTVTLTIRVFDGSFNGPPLAGVWVHGTDGAHNVVARATNASGYASVSGSPGIWIFGLSRDGYTPLNGLSWNVSANVGLQFYMVPQPGIDLSVSKPKPIQVVWDVDINGDGKTDLVNGKPAMAMAKLTITGNLGDQQTVGVQWALDGIVYDFSYTIADLRQNQNNVKFFFTPMVAGDHNLNIRVDPNDDISEINENNNTNSVDFSIKDTKVEKIGYIPVQASKAGSGYGPLNLADYSQTVVQSTSFLSATYPLAPNNLQIFNPPYSFYGTDIKDFETSVALDLQHIWVLGKRAGLNELVGIVPENYFGYHTDPDTVGASWYFTEAVTYENHIRAALVKVNSWTTAAHEIGHINDLHTKPEEYIVQDKVITYKGNTANGYWVTTPTESKEILDGICFMGVGGSDKTFNTSVGHPTWIDNADYIDLFKKFRINPQDPSILLISGTITRDGLVSLGRTYMIEAGDLEIPPSGDYSIQTFDKNGHVLSTIPFDEDFQLNADPIGIVQTDIVPFGFTVPYLENLATIKIKHNSDVLYMINANISLLDGIIDSIPNNGFKNNPDERRKALHNEASAIGKMIEKQNYTPAINALKNSVKNKLEDWLVDNYSVQNLEQLTKQEVFKAIDQIIMRMK